MLNIIPPEARKRIPTLDIRRLSTEMPSISEFTASYWKPAQVAPKPWGGKRIIISRTPLKSATTATKTPEQRLNLNLARGNAVNKE
jgi:hypothetical protein